MLISLFNGTLTDHLIEEGFSYELPRGPEGVNIMLAMYECVCKRAAMEGAVYAVGVLMEMDMFSKAGKGKRSASDNKLDKQDRKATKQVPSPDWSESFMDMMATPPKHKSKANAG